MRALVIGGSRFFGKRLVQNLLKEGHSVYVYNRGSEKLKFDGDLTELKGDRTNKQEFKNQIRNLHWDIVFDQVCFDYQSALEACEIFSDKTSRYIFTSSQSVYGPGEDIKEESFDPQNYSFEKKETMDSNYGEAKRQAEVAFATKADFPVTMVRFPVVVGEDDYTKRFRFHLERVKESKPIYFPNPDANISFIQASDAARALAFLGRSHFKGPINVASPKAIPLRKFLELIEREAQGKINWAESATEENHSPYGIKEDWYMNCNKMENLGLHLKDIESWLPDLVKR